MSLYTARRASLLVHDERRSPDTDNDDHPVLHLRPRYTCDLTDNDCGNGYCCSAAHECVLPSSSSGETLCQLPGFSTANAVASLASDATGSVTTGTAAATAAGTAVVISNGGISGSTGSSSTSSTGGGGSSSLSAGAIAGIVVGVVVALAAVVGAVVFLLCVRRKRGNRRARNTAATPDVTETGYSGGPLSSSSQGPPVYQRVPGGGGDGGSVDMYAGSNVGKMHGGVPGRVEAMGDTAQRPVVQELPGNEGLRPVELDAGAEKK